MSKVKISIKGKQASVKFNGQEINDIITNLSVNIGATQSPTITITLVPFSLEINGESFDVNPLDKTTDNL